MSRPGRSAIERRVLAALREGGRVDLELEREEGKLCAVRLARWLTLPGVRRQLPVHGFRLRHATIAGELDLRSAALAFPVSLIGCTFEDRVRLDEACLRSLDLTGSTVTRLEARGAQVDGVLRLTRVRGERIHLRGARIGGDLVLDGATLHRDGESPALSADHLRVGGSLSVEPDEGRAADLTGVSLVGASVAGRASFVGATLDGRGGPALHARLLCVDGELLCRSSANHLFQARGEVDLSGARIRGRLSLDGARLDAHPGGRSLGGHGLEVEGGVFGEPVAGKPLSTRGRLDLTGARITGELRLEQGLLHGDQGCALDLKRATIGELHLPAGGMEGPEPHIDLTQAQVNGLHDGWALEAGPRPRARVDGFRYERLGESCGDVSQRLRWLERVQGGDGYAPDAYAHLGAVLRGEGREVEARRVAVAMQRRRTRHAGLPLPSRGLGALSGSFTGYGFQTWRLVVALVGVVLVGWGIFGLASPEHVIALRPDVPGPAYHSFLLSLDAVVPLSLGPTSRWAATGAAQYWSIASAILGWILCLGVVASLTHALFRR